MSSKRTNGWTCSWERVDKFEDKRKRNANKKQKETIRRKEESTTNVNRKI